MATLHITKPAVGCDSIDRIRQRQAPRIADGEVTITTRYRPTRHAELVGGSIFWIIKHRLVVRQRILGFAESGDGRWHIRLDPKLIPVRARPKRAHQGWRYLKGEDAPADFDGDEDGIAEMPAKMLTELARLGLV
ncbi:MAG: DUF1489 family protein [Parasphingopyxis sp.]|uniref:DUF1489 family protein n=1 Tax=Parasphingopyxis sp. TaxID=1920299 RepID=UPI003FA00378